MAGAYQRCEEGEHTWEVGEHAALHGCSTREEWANLDLEELVGAVVVHNREMPFVFIKFREGVSGNDGGYCSEENEIEDVGCVVGRG